MSNTVYSLETILIILKNCLCKLSVGPCLYSHTQYLIQNSKHLSSLFKLFERVL